MKPVVRLAFSLFCIVLLSSACTQPADTASTTTPPTSTSTGATEPALPPAAVTPVLASVVAAPVPVLASDQKMHLAYELMVTNTLGSDVALNSLTVASGDDKLLTLAGDKLAYWTRVLGDGQTPATRLGPGQSGLIWVDVAVDRGAVPTTLQHTLAIAPSKPSPPLFPATMAELVAPVTVSTREAIAVTPPLTGANWLNGDSCCDMGGHRMAMNPINGGLWAAERFAIDYVQLGTDGTMYHNAANELTSYPYFGVDIHAVSDGPVVAVVNDLPEQVPGANPTGLTLEQYGGNHVVQDIGNGNFAFYAHLKTGSVKVKVGDQLTTGQVLANLGNSGNSDAPHLHFHVMDGPDPLYANGLPYVFKSYTLDGAVASTASLGLLADGKPAPMRPGIAPRQENDTYPLMLDVMSYAGP